MNKYLPRALVTAAFIAASVAQAATLDFNNTDPLTFQTDQYTEDGFKVYVNTGHYDFFTYSTNYINIDTVAYGPAKITFSALGGGAFDLLNFDVITPGGGLLESSNGGSFTLESAGVVSFSGLQWTNITSFSLSTTSEQYVGIDNINVTPVPEPEIYAMMGLGLGLLGWVGRRRKLAA